MYIKIHVIAGSKHQKIVERENGSLDIFIKEKAERNMANERVLQIMHTLYPEAKQVRIVNGHHSPTKLLSIDEKRYNEYMNINIKTTNISLTDALRDYVNKRYAPLEKFIPGNTLDLLTEVEIGKTTNHHNTGDIFRAEVMISVKGGPIRAVSEKADLYAAIDDVRDQLERILVSHKDKKATLWKKGSQQIKNMMKGLGF